MIRWRSLLAGAAGLAAVQACDPSSPTAGIDRGGMRTPVAVQGPITGFGSIVVGGVHYALDAAEVRIDGALATEADLVLGEVVTIRGSREDDGGRGSADTVTVTTNVQGQVSVTDPSASTLVVLGQDIRTDSITVFDLGGRPPSVASVVVGELVRVSGFVGADGAIAATRIETRPAGSELRVVGMATNLKRAAARFEINGLVVDYSMAVVIEGFPNGQPSDGDRVIVVGDLVGQSGTLRATTLERRAVEIDEREGDEFEVEGLVTRFVSPQDFDVSGVTVTTTAATRYEDGSAASLALNVRVEISGRVNSALQVEASSVEFGD